MKTIESDPIADLLSTIWRIFGDSFISMIVSGALGHQLNIRFLLHLGYWNFVLICIGLQALWPITSPSKWRVKE